MLYSSPKTDSWAAWQPRSNFMPLGVSIVAFILINYQIGNACMHAWGGEGVKPKCQHGLLCAGRLVSN